ncbi:MULTISPECIES: 50S ribosomal protein L6 [Malaciobacter]|jgi:large subunit ribosomal protein L6|uniref:Large ribosomal subunit protein uL6 n=2 Tax=Malaciobacter TaxID=2321114 RepID=A0AB36ZYM8_9BACT|nr:MULTISPECIES: 50S ribosomal protein L6 [Malaciobacter]PHO10379.1 50S ribosomal protein L6 [Malaciobacter canalis]PPK61991.1 large subunit ribosomal protein L6 [Malaciobacter marinus]QEE32483.1 50S ribosomal protein L6 [Malaciobacter canalis]SKB26076.1 large subunit ribosomal protein L6 [Malaciobacter marinus]
MSRIGKRPISIPNGIEVTVDNTVVSVKKGSKVSSIETHGRVGIEVADNQVVLTRVNDTKEASAFWGTYRALINNAVLGLDKGFAKSLEINGVGYRAAVKGKVLELQLGYSHPINYDIPEGLDITVEKNLIHVKGADKQQVGQAAAIIRGFRKPEPYKGKGVKYTDEVIVRKAGKTAK